MAAILLIVGAACLTTGAAFIYWPAAFVVLGIYCTVLAAVVDLATASAVPEVREPSE